MSGSEGRQSQEFLKIFKIFSQRSCKCKFHLNAISCHFRPHTSITLLFALQARQGFNRGRSKAIVLKTCSPRADGSVGNTYPSINPHPPPSIFISNLHESTDPMFCLSKSRISDDSRKTLMPAYNHCTNQRIKSML